MRDLFEQEALLRELSAALARLSEETSQAYEVLGEVVGALAASGKPSELHYATTTVQRAFRAHEQEGHHTVLTLVKEVLRAAASHHSGTLSAERSKALEASVRGRVLASIQGLAPIRSSDVARKLDIKVPQASRALSELAHQHLGVKAENGSLDGRARYWQLAPSALADRAPASEYRAGMSTIATTVPTIALATPNHACVFATAPFSGALERPMFSRAVVEAMLSIDFLLRC